MMIKTYKYRLVSDNGMCMSANVGDWKIGIPDEKDFSWGPYFWGCMQVCVSVFENGKEIACSNAKEYYSYDSFIKEFSKTS